MAAPGGDDSRQKSSYNAETSGEDEVNESMKHPLLAPRPVEASKSRPSASSADENVDQSYGYPDLEAGGVSLDSSLLPENVKLTGYVNESVRSYKDVPFAVAFLVVLGLAVVGGLVALNTGDHQFHRYHSEYVRHHSFVNNQGMCSVKHPSFLTPGGNVTVFKDSFDPLRLPMQVHGYRGHGDHQGRYHDDAPSLVGVIIGSTVLLTMLVVSVGAALGIGMGCNWLFKTYTEAIATRVIPGFLITCILLLLGGATMSGNGAQSWLFLIFASGCCVSLVLLLRRSRLSNIDLSIRILKVASQSISDNLQLLSVMLYMLSAGIAILSLVSIFIAGTFNHHSVLVPNPDVVPGAPCGGEDLDAVPCCVRVLEDWTKFYAGLIGVFSIWTLFLLKQLHTYAVSGTVGQWYFAPSGSSSVHFTTSAMRNGVGKSFGTLCCASLMSTVIYVARLLASRLPGRDGCQSAVSFFTRCCLSCVEEMVSFFTRFTVSFAAITGESFLSSAKLTFNLLKRNFRSTVVVDLFADYVLKLYAFLCIVTTTVVVVGLIQLISSFINVEPDVDSVTGLQITLMFTTAILVLILWASWYVLLWFVSAIRIAVDTIFICFALDKEVGKVSKPEAHEVYVLLPSSDPDEANLAVGLSSTRRS